MYEYNAQAKTVRGYWKIEKLKNWKIEKLKNWKIYVIANFIRMIQYYNHFRRFKSLYIKYFLVSFNGFIWFNNI